jgi:hypothetical protein
MADAAVKVERGSLGQVHDRPAAWAVGTGEGIEARCWTHDLDIQDIHDESSFIAAACRLGAACGTETTWT